MKARGQTMEDYNETMFLAQKMERGQDLAEYALLLGLIAVIVIVAVTIMGQNISSIFSVLGSTIGSWW